MWKHSDLKAKIEKGEFPPKFADGVPLAFNFGADTDVRLPAYICVDAAFGGSAHTVKPYPHTHNVHTVQFLFNKIQSKARQVIEQAWGMLVNRFRMWKAPCELSGANWQLRVSKLIHASMILHNIAIDHADYASGIFCIP
jgi:hypothetical protein